MANETAYGNKQQVHKVISEETTAAKNSAPKPIPGETPASTEDYITDDQSPGVQQSVARKAAVKLISLEETLRSELKKLPSDFLIINDVAIHGAAVVSINVSTSADMFIGETLRTSAPVIQTKGTSMDYVNISVKFPNGRAQQLQLRRIMGILLKHPFVFIENNKVRESLGIESETMMFVLHHGSVSADTKQIGVITLNLQLATFNYKPFSNHFWFNAEFPFPQEEEPQQEKTHGELLPGDFIGRASYDFSVSKHHQIAAAVPLPKVEGRLFTPVVYPSQSKSWMFYADHLETMLPRISDTNKDFVALEVTKYEVFIPPEEARLSSAKAASVFGVHGRERTPAPFYNAEAAGRPFDAKQQPLEGQGGDGRTTQGGVTETGAIARAQAQEHHGRKSCPSMILYLSDENKPNEGEFERQARVLKKKYPNSHVCKIRRPLVDSDTKYKRKQIVQGQVDAAFAQVSNVSLVMFLCHGAPKALWLYPGGVLALPNLAQSMSYSTTRDVRVVLYACQCGRKPGFKYGTDVRAVKNIVEASRGSYAESLRKKLVFIGKDKCQVDTHLSSRHTTRNHDCVRFTTSRTTGETRGQWIVDPHGKFWEQWVKAMQDLTYDLEYRFPMMTTEQVHDDLATYTGKGGKWVKHGKIYKTYNPKFYR